jgi:hypothetical protein
MGGQFSKNGAAWTIALLNFCSSDGTALRETPLLTGDFADCNIGGRGMRRIRFIFQEPIIHMSSTGNAEKQSSALSHKPSEKILFVYCHCEDL